MMNNTPSSALEEPDPHSMLIPSMVVPQAKMMVDDLDRHEFVKNGDVEHALNHLDYQPSPPCTSSQITSDDLSKSSSMHDFEYKSSISSSGSQLPGEDLTKARGLDPPISDSDFPSGDDNITMDPMTNFAYHNSNLLLLNIPNPHLIGDTAASQLAPGGAIFNGGQGIFNGMTPSSLMPVLVVGGNSSKGESETLMPQFLRFKDFAEANLICATQESIARTFNTLPPETPSPREQKQTEKGIKCEECGRIFKSTGHYRYHLETHKGNRVLKCPIKGCNRRFAWPAHLKYHVRTHSNDRQYSCKVSGCTKTFYTVQSLQVHMRSHTGCKPFYCDEEGCGKSFTTAGNLQNHKRTHTGEKPFRCTYEFCNLRFAELSSLKKHKLTHTGEKPYECEICGKQFSQCGSRNAHRKRHKIEILAVGGVDSPADESPLDLHLTGSEASLTGTSDSTSLSVQHAIRGQTESRLTLNQSVLEGLGSDQPSVDKSSLDDPSSSSGSVLVLPHGHHPTLTMATNPPLNHNPSNPGDSLLCNAFLQSELDQTGAEEVVSDVITVNQALNMDLWNTHE